MTQKFLILCLGLFLITFSCKNQENSTNSNETTLRIENVHIVDIENRKIHHNQIIDLDGSTIVGIWDADIDELTPADSVIDARGKYAMPMIADMHHHLSSSDFDFGGNTPERQLQILKDQKLFGIQALLNPNISLEATSFLLSADSLQLYPKFALTGPSIGPKNGWARHQLNSEAEIDSILQKLDSLGLQHIKIAFDDMSWLGGSLPKLHPELLNYCIIQAQKKNLKVLVHAPNLDDAKAVLKLGANGIIHAIVDKKIDEEFIQLMQKNDAVYIPTTALYETCFNFRESVKNQFEYDPRQYFDQIYKDSLSNAASAETWNQWWPRSAELAYQLNNVYHNTKLAYDKGLNVMLGSDTGTPGVLPGISALYEMELLEKSGLSSFEVLECSVINPLKYLNLYSSGGTITKGKTANIILVENDPSASMKNMNSIRMVIHNGQIY